MKAKLSVFSLLVLITTVQSHKIELNLNLNKNLECRVANSNKTGVIKFLSDCPEIDQHEADVHVNKICSQELCSDLVCCPTFSLHRLKSVCWNVDHPVDTLRLRLYLHSECTVNGLNIKGRYQTKWACGYAKRNPNLNEFLYDVCNDEVCDNWLCCPIGSGDEFGCSSNQIADTTASLVGPKCTDTKSGRNGTCKRAADCAHFDVQSLDKCGTYCCKEFYCCPENEKTDSRGLKRGELMCNSFTKNLSKEIIEVPMNLYVNRTRCDYVSPAGGIIANPGEFPHMAALGYQSNRALLWLCGGALVSDRYVLTAGHCLISTQVGPVQKVRLGVVDLENEVTTEDCPEEYDVANIIPHPEYKPRLVYNDIGLIELASRVNFNYHIRPICLPNNGDLPNRYISMGWGATGSFEKRTIKLIKVIQELFSYEECQNQYDVGRKHPDGIKNDTQICAGSRDSIQSTCPGDSGGPLIVQHPAHSKLFYIYGIVSFGTVCGFPGSPGIYTKVFPFINWIEETVWKH